MSNARTELQICRVDSKLVEDFYRDLGALQDFEVAGRYQKTMPVLLQVLHKNFHPVASDETKVVAQPLRHQTFDERCTRCERLKLTT